MGRRKDKYCYYCDVKIDPEEYEYYGTTGDRICEDCHTAGDRCWNCDRDEWSCTCCEECDCTDSNNPSCDVCAGGLLDNKEW